MKDQQAWNVVRALIVEFIGPFALVFVGAGAIIATQGGDLVAIALAHGLAIGLLVAAAGHVSGGVYNPALTIGLAIARKLSPTLVIPYIVVQLLGATAAALCLKAVFPSAAIDKVSLGVPAVGKGFGTGGAFVAEVIMTFFLMFVVYGTAVDERGPRAIAALAIGLTITMDIFVGGAASGAAMNPARHFGPALIGNHWANWWLWWLAPIIGAILAAALYAYVLQVQSAPPQPDVLDGEVPRDRRV
ncbi:MAG: aquaporin [Thermomicrobiales bacterium]